MKLSLSILPALVLPVSGALSMDRFDALSQIESHDNDRAIGRYREVSRYQILPAYWAQATGWGKPQNPANPAAARAVARRILDARCRAFEVRYHRAPTDFEYYILWHRPACLIGRPVLRPLTTAEVDRGRRFANLCQNRE